MSIIQGFPTPQNNYYKVYVRSITYNQAPYIEDSMNGVAMQETNFPFVHHVIDDASTDGEQDVIKAWMEKNCEMEHAEYYDNDICTITLVKNKKNPNCTLAAYLLKKNMYGTPKKGELYTIWREVCPYEALCEGDDYWIDPKKLQKQVDYLESHQEYDMVCARFSHLSYTGEIINSDLYDKIVESDIKGLELKQEHFLNFVQPHPCTVLYRQETLYDNPFIHKLKYQFDIPTYWCFMYSHRVWLMNERMSIYRKHQGSLTDGGNWVPTMFASAKEMLEYFPKDETLKKLCGDYYKSWKTSAVSNCNYSFLNLLNDIKVYVSFVYSIRERIVFMKLMSKLYLSNHLQIIYKFLRNVKHIIKH